MEKSRIESSIVKSKNQVSLFLYYSFNRYIWPSGSMLARQPTVTPNSVSCTVVLAWLKYTSDVLSNPKTGTSCSNYLRLQSFLHTQMKVKMPAFRFSTEKILW